VTSRMDESVCRIGGKRLHLVTRRGSLCVYGLCGVLCLMSRRPHAQQLTNQTHRSVGRARIPHACPGERILHGDRNDPAKRSPFKPGGEAFMDRAGDRHTVRMIRQGWFYRNGLTRSKSFHLMRSNGFKRPTQW